MRTSTSAPPSIISAATQRRLAPFDEQHPSTLTVTLANLRERLSSSWSSGSQSARLSDTHEQLSQARDEAAQQRVRADQVVQEADRMVSERDQLWNDLAWPSRRSWPRHRQKQTYGRQQWVIQVDAGNFATMASPRWDDQIIVVETEQ